MDLQARIKQEFDDAARALDRARAVVVPGVAAAVQLVVDALLADSRVFACGDGAAAADAQRLCTALVTGFERMRPPIAAVSLCSDPTLLGALAQAGDGSGVFATQVAAFGRRGDVLVALGADPASPSLAAAIHGAHDHGMRVILVCGAGDGEAAHALAPGDVGIQIPLERPARLEELRRLALNCLCDGIDATLIGAET